jgi:hypothetical protein
MALERLHRLRKRQSDSARADAAHRNREVDEQDERLREGKRLQRSANEQGCVAIAELLAEASVRAIEARRVAQTRADTATASAVEAHRKMRQVELVLERQAANRARRRAARAQSDSDEHASRPRRAAR